MRTRSRPPSRVSQWLFLCVLVIGTGQSTAEAPQDTASLISDLWASAQDDLTQSRHVECAQKFDQLARFFDANGGTGEEVQRLAIQSRVNKGVCLQEQGTSAFVSAAAEAYRDALQLQPSFAGARRRLCSLLIQRPTLAAHPLESSEVCGEFKVQSIATDVSGNSLPVQCGSLLVSTGSGMNEDENLFMQPTYSAWWLRAGLVRAPSEIQSNSFSVSILQHFPTTFGYYARVFDQIANRKLQSLQTGIAELTAALQMDESRLRKLSSVSSALHAARVNLSVVKRSSCV